NDTFSFAYRIYRVRRTLFCFDNILKSLYIKPVVHSRFGPVMNRTDYANGFHHHIPLFGMLFHPLFPKMTVVFIRVLYPLDKKLVRKEMLNIVIFVSHIQWINCPRFKLSNLLG